MPDDPEKRTPEQTAELARETMRRMLATPPTPHERVNQRGKRKAAGKSKRVK